MDDMSEGAEFLEFDAPAPEELTVPPVLYAVPAATMGPLEQGQLVTVSVATGWLVDENFVVDGPAGAGDGESYDIASWVEYGAMQVRPHEQTTSDGTKVSVKVRPVPTTDLWVYRPAPGEHDLEDIPPWHPGLWFERVIEGGPPVTPPSPRRPRPARELPSLTGRRLYGPSFTPSGTMGTDWHWWVAITEPISEEGGIYVRVLTIAEWERARNGAGMGWRGIPLHRLFAY